MVVMSATLLCLAAGCDDPKSDGGDASASATASTKAPSAPTVRSFARMPDMVVDDLGPSLGGQRVDLSVPTGPAKLKEIAAKLPINDKQVILRTTHKARVRDVAAVLVALGEEGAPEVLLKMSGGRRDVPTEYVVVPETRISNPDPCSVVATVTENMSTGVWPFKGGGGKRHRKGHAGPDLTLTGESIDKALSKCQSKTAFFSSHTKLRWEHAFHMGALIRKSDEKKKIDKLVLLGEEPVAGRPVKLRP